MTAATVRSVIRTHPEHRSHADVIARCVDACFTCVEACTACADACLSERGVEHLIACVRLDLDCAAVATATGQVLSRATRAGNRQPLEAQLTTCIAFCRACARECSNHASAHEHCKVCAQACLACAAACDQMLDSLRMPA